MTVQRFTHPSEPFTAVQWTGDNLEEIREFLAEPMTVAGGTLCLSLHGDELCVLEKGWWVSRDPDGDLRVSSARAAESWVPVEV